MSRNIDPHSVLSEEEIQYLTDRGRMDVLAENAAWLISTGAPEEDTTSTEGSETLESTESTENTESANSPEGEDTGVSDDSGAGETGVLARVAPVEYNKLTRKDMLAIIDQRNAERPENGLPLLQGNTVTAKNELVATLLADDALIASRQ